jgi:cytochrome c556
MFPIRSTLVALASLALISAFCSPSAQVAEAEQPPFKPVARVSSLMRGIGTALGQINEGIVDTENEHRFGNINAWAEVLAELSNVHAQHGRKTAKYLEMAANTGSIALDVARTARADIVDEGRLKTLYAQLDTSCATCHDSDE